MAGRSSRNKPTIPGWSIFAAALGLTLVTGSAGYMLYQAFTGDSSPPEMAIEVDTVVSNGQGYLARITVENRGGSAAAGLVIEGVLESDTGSVETSTITIGYVPSQSEREAGLYFSNDPRVFDLRIRAKGYEQP